MNQNQVNVAKHALCGGWKTVKDLASTEAGKYRIAHRWDNWSDYALSLTDDPVDCPFAEPEAIATFGLDHPECELMLFSDGSLYYANNAQDEVWADATDFIAECRKWEDEPECDVYRLAKHLGMVEEEN